MRTNWEEMSVDELEKAVRRHNHLYFVKNQPDISDEEFDRLVQTLKRKKPDSPLLNEIGSDTPPVALPAGGEGKTVRHKIAMLSLDKCYDEKELRRWAGKFEGKVIAMPKIDGCAVALHYGKGGELTLAATRGNGLEGEIITPNVFHVQPIPKKISLENVEVRGEIYMPLSVFKAYRGTFANPRNLAAGAIKQKDPKKTSSYQLSFFAYDLLFAGCKAEGEKRRLLGKEHFPLVEGELIGPEELQEVFERFHQKRLNRDYETDGVVYKANDVAWQKRLGFTAHHPRYAIAYKFQGESGETMLRDVLWSVSRTGTITPVGIVDPVFLSGAQVTRVSLHNFGLAKKMGVTVPSKVLIARRGGVIPNLEKVIEGGGRSLQPPEHCPSCGSSAKLKDDFIFCTHPSKCAVSKIGELNHFVKVVGIDGFGKKHLGQLYENGLVRDPSDFFLLKMEDLLPLGRMGETLARKLIANISAKRELPLDLFLRGLGIEELGKHVAKILAGYGSLERIFKLTEGELLNVHSIGEKIAPAVLNGIREKMGLIDSLLKHVRLKTGIPVKKEGGPLEGKSFLFTGSLAAFSRAKAMELVESKGGIAALRVSKSLNYLVVGDQKGGEGSKIKKVKILKQSGISIRILSENEFKKMVE